PFPLSPFLEQRCSVLAPVRVHLRVLVVAEAEVAEPGELLDVLGLDEAVDDDEGGLLLLLVERHHDQAAEGVAGLADVDPHVVAIGRCAAGAVAAHADERLPALVLELVAEVGEAVGEVGDGRGEVVDADGDAVEALHEGGGAGLVLVGRRGGEAEERLVEVDLDQRLVVEVVVEEGEVQGRRRRRHRLREGARREQEADGDDEEEQDEAVHGVSGQGIHRGRVRARASVTCSRCCPTLERTASVAWRLASAKRVKARRTPSRADATSAGVGSAEGSGAGEGVGRAAARSPLGAVYGAGRGARRRAVGVVSGRAGDGVAVVSPAPAGTGSAAGRSTAGGVGSGVSVEATGSTGAGSFAGRARTRARATRATRPT